MAKLSRPTLRYVRFELSRAARIPGRKQPESVNEWESGAAGLVLEKFNEPFPEPPAKQLACPAAELGYKKESDN